MTLSTTQVSVGTTATRLSSASETDDRGGQRVAGRNISSVIIWVGGSDVTTANGLPIYPNDPFDDDLQPGEQLYGVVVAGTATMAMYRGGV